MNEKLKTKESSGLQNFRVNIWFTMGLDLNSGNAYNISVSSSIFIEMCGRDRARPHAYTTICRV